MRIRPCIAILSLLVPATVFAESPDHADDEVTTSYRHQTLAMDGLGLALILAGAAAEDDGGRDTKASDVLVTVGGLTSLFGTPIIHGARGHGGRALGSFALRLGSAGVGAYLAVAANSGCGDGQPAPNGALLDDDFLCELDYMGYGLLGGLVVASVLDAAFMTDERVEPPSWSPQVAATSDGVRVGAAFVW